jgi:hypothetical protein
MLLQLLLLMCWMPAGSPCCDLHGFSASAAAAAAAASMQQTRMPALHLVRQYNSARCWPQRSELVVVAAAALL